MTWFVYLIECTDGSIYTGIALDVAARYAAHARGKGARYTRSHPPARLLASFEYPDRSAASSAEYRIRQLSAQEKRDPSRTAAAAAARSRAEASGAKRLSTRDQGVRSTQAAKTAPSGASATGGRGRPAKRSG